MTNAVLMTFMTITLLLGFISGYCLAKPVTDSYWLGVIWAIALIVICVSVSNNDRYRTETNEYKEYVAKFGTYPDTTITIRNGVNDTTVIHLVKVQK